MIINFRNLPQENIFPDNLGMMLTCVKGGTTIGWKQFLTPLQKIQMAQMVGDAICCAI